MDNMFRCTLASGGGALVLTVTCDADFAGYSVTVTDGTSTLTQTCPSSSPYEIEFNLPNVGQWTISSVISGETYSTQIIVSDYTAELEYGFNWKKWVTFGGLDPTDYTDLADVFSDEAAVRRLMTVHASADYLIDCVTDKLNDIDAFCANDTAMKWIGLRDYVCDGLTAITGVEAKFLASQYWERYLKDHVPTMTSNTAPYGTASATNESTTASEKAYAAFDGNDNTNARKELVAATPGSIIYCFTNPINVKKVRYFVKSNNYVQTYTFKFSYSDDGTNWTDACELLEYEQEIGDIELWFTPTSDCGYHRYWRFYKNSSENWSIYASTLQFYGRSLDVSVPVMTSNTAPYGVVSASSLYSSPEYEPFKAFDGNRANTGWFPSGNNDQWINYQFTSALVPKMMIAVTRGGSFSNVILQGSNNGGEFTQLTTGQIVNSTPLILSLQNTNSYDTLRVSCDVAQASGNFGMELQFYGVDYSEKEFETGTTKKWLYDHGVELETIDITGTATKGDDYITMSAANAQASHTIDLTLYDLLRGKVGDHMSGTTALIAGTTATANMTAANAPNNESLDVSSVNASLATGAKMTSTGVCDITELWLE